MAATSMIDERLTAASGRWRSEGPASFPIGASDIRRWAIATYWPLTPPRLYWDEGHARTTRWGGVIAPEDFNPFAWPVPAHPPGLEPYHPRPGEPGQHLLNGGPALTCHLPMRPGDVISARRRVKQFEERNGRFGLMLYLQIERELTNQRNELVRTSIDTIIRY